MKRKTTQPTKATLEERALMLAGQQGLLRCADLDSQGIPRTILSRMTQAGKLERVSRGLYRAMDAPVSEQISLQIVARKMPDAVFCLLTALQFHGLTTQVPRQVWVAMPRGSHAPQFEYPALRMIRSERNLLALGVQTHVQDGVTLKVHSPTRTVVDCFKHRSKVGLDVAIEALRDALAQKKTTMDALWQQAAALRVANVMQPYLEGAV